MAYNYDRTFVPRSEEKRIIIDYSRILPAMTGSKLKSPVSGEIELQMALGRMEVRNPSERYTSTNGSGSIKEWREHYDVIFGTFLADLDKLREAYAPHGLTLNSITDVTGLNAALSAARTIQTNPLNDYSDYYPLNFKLSSWKPNKRDPIAGFEYPGLIR